MGLELEINAATRAFLPEGALEFATPVRRVELKSPDGGESKNVIGQLIPNRIDLDLGHSYSLIFRFEYSEIDTNFITHGKEKIIWATLEEACEYFLVEEFLSREFSNFFKGFYSRPWLTTHCNESILLLFSGRNFGVIHRHEQQEVSLIFRCSYEDQLSLFEMSNLQFDKWILNVYEDEESELNFALRWLELEDNEKNQVALFCIKGNWDELKRVAKLVLQVALGQEEFLPDEEFKWAFTSYDYSHTITSRNGYEVTGHTDFFARWRLALVTHFQPKYLGEWDFIEKIPFCVRDHISKSEHNLIKSYKPSNHELVEAQLQLSNWLKENSIQGANGS